MLLMKIWFNIIVYWCSGILEYDALPLVIPDVSKALPFETSGTTDSSTQETDVLSLMVQDNGFQLSIMLGILSFGNCFWIKAILHVYLNITNSMEQHHA